MSTSKHKIELAEALLAALVHELPVRVSRLDAAAAARFDLGATDWSCLALIRHRAQSEAVTAGRLAEWTGLTSGAITGVLDRLERRGLVVREKAATDRRQVRVRLVAGRASELDAEERSLRGVWLAACAGHDAEGLSYALELVRDAMRAIDVELAKDHRRAAAAEEEEDPPDVRSAPRGELERATLDFPHGVAQLTLSTLSGERLYRARFGGRPPERIRTRAGVVSIDGLAGGWLEALLGRRADVRVELNEDVAWTVRVRGGASHVTGDLSKARIEGVRLEGGASYVSLQLGAPRGTASVEVKGGLSDVRLAHPANVPVRVALRGGASSLVIGEMRLSAVGDDLRWESPGFAAARDRYDVDIVGGASALAIVPG